MGTVNVSRSCALLLALAKCWSRQSWTRSCNKQEAEEFFVRASDLGTPTPSRVHAFCVDQ